VKRLFDLMLAVPAAALLALPVLLVALAVKLSSPGPALYWSIRMPPICSPIRLST
jgi:O-antigen biosynthesis protein WbqP